MLFDQAQGTREVAEWYCILIKTGTVNSHRSVIGVLYQSQRISVVSEIDRNCMITTY